VENRKYTEEMQRHWGKEIAGAERLVAAARADPLSHGCGDYVVELNPEDFLDLCAGKWNSGYIDRDAPEAALAPQRDSGRRSGAGGLSAYLLEDD
jgi:hypothetical protein